MENIYYLLKLTKKEIPKEYEKEFYSKKAIENNCCQRCGAICEKVCNECSEFGQLTDEDNLYIVKNKKAMQKINYEDSLQKLNLTDLQQKAADFMIDKINQKKDGLIWAVCGAGKTEITFKAIEEVLRRKGLVCFAIPRIDILYEIKERLEEFFPKTKIALLCGKEKEYKNAQIFVVTTNQLIKFNDAFDLIIIDELMHFRLR